MRWEGQELNHTSPEGKYPEVLAAKFGLLAEAERSSGRYVRVDQPMLDTLPLRALCEKKESPRIDRVCLHFRLSCGLGAGGERYPVLGVMHYCSDSKSHYAIVHISPSNDWLRVMSVAAEEPIQPPQTTPASSAGLRV